MRKLLMFVLITISGFMFSSVLTHASTDYPSWTSQDGYYYYNQPIILSDGLLVNLSSELDISSLEFSYNDGAWTSVAAKPDGTYILQSDITEYLPNNIALHNLMINETLVASIGVDMAYPQEINLQIRTEGVPEVSIPRETTEIKSEFHTWEIGFNNGVYFLKSNKVKNLSNKIYIGVGTSFKGVSSTINNFIVESIDTQTSRIDVFSTSDSIHIKESHNLRYQDATSNDALYLYGTNINDDVYLTEGDYYQIILVLKGGLTASEKNEIAAAFNSGYRNANTAVAVNFYVTAYISPVTINPTDPLSFELLPETSGSVFDNTNQMGDVEVTDLGNNQFQFKITYNGIYLVNYTFSAQTDTSIFNNSYEMFYYTSEGQKFIVFNRGETSMFRSTNWKTQTFIPYTTWNLNTNELSSINEFNVYLYTRLEAGSNAYAYFYVDDFVIENLLSVSMSMQYRYVSVFGTQGEWTPYLKTLEDGNINPGSVSWKLKAAVISTTATAIGSFATGFSLPVMIIGTNLSFYLNRLTFQELLDNGSLSVGDISEIQKVTPTAELASEVNGAYQDYYEAFEGMDLSTYGLFKLHLGTFNKPWQDRIEINMDEGGLNVIQFKYMTDGQIYTIDDASINEVFNPGELVQTPDTPRKYPQWIDDLLAFIAEHPVEIIIAVIVLAVVLVVIIVVLKVVGLTAGVGGAIRGANNYKRYNNRSQGSVSSIAAIISSITFLIIAVALIMKFLV